MRRQRPCEERRVLSALGRQRLGAVERDRVEAPSALGHELADGEVLGVEGLEGMSHLDLIARPAFVGPHRAVDHVQQLADRHRRRADEVRALVVAGVGDDELVGGGEERVEQQLAVLGAGVAVADVGVGEHEVVAVAGGLAREDAVVHAEQADDPMRDRPHRHERADGEVAGAEVRPRRAALEALAEQRPDLRRHEARRAPAAARLVRHVAEDAVELGALPGVTLAGRGQRIGGAGDGRGPGVDRLRRAEAVEGSLKPIHQLGEPARDVDRPAVDVVEREDVVEQPLLLLGHGDADQEPVHPRAPRPRGERVELERLSVRGVEPPPDATRRDPVLDASEVVIVEPEPPPHRLLVGEVEHLRGGQPLVDEVEQPPDDAEHRVRLTADSSA